MTATPLTPLAILGPLAEADLIAPWVDGPDVDLDGLLGSWMGSALSSGERAIVLLAAGREPEGLHHVDATHMARLVALGAL